MKRIAAIHDLSGFGKSSLTVVIPILSAMGMQVCPVPTAVLSTQTDGFPEHTFLDLTENMKKHLSHWNSMDLTFDSVYTGYLGSHAQVEIIMPFVRAQKAKGAVILIDPVLGDNGSLYSGITEKMVADMRRLISDADIITPNFTEAGFLLGDTLAVFENFKDTENYIRKFTSVTNANVIITSVNIQGRHYNICFDRSINDVYNIEFEMRPKNYPGSGDTFSSLLLGKLLQTKDFTLSAFYATNRTSYMVTKALESGCEQREGLPVELFLNELDET